jgi:hypothetical protein
MVKIWMCREDTINAVRTIKTIWSRNRTLPPDLVIAYKEILGTASKGLVALFYERMADQCPDAIAYFDEVKQS